MSHDPADGLLAFQRASRRYLPNPVRLLFIAEAPPAYGSKRFFYFTGLTTQDTLFVELMKVLYPNEIGFRDDVFLTPYSAKLVRSRKGELLGCFQQDGYYLIDASDVPLPPDASVGLKRSLLQKRLIALRERLSLLLPSHDIPIVLIGAVTYAVCANALREEGYRILNVERIDHPARGGQRAFRSKLSGVLAGSQIRENDRLRHP